MNVFRHIAAFDVRHPDVMTTSTSISTTLTTSGATISVVLMNMSDEDIRWTRNIMHIFPRREEATLRGSIPQESVIYHSWIKV